MPHISRRGTAIPPSPIRKLQPLIDGAQKDGKHVYHINIGQPDILTPKAFMEGMAKSNPVLSYSPSSGLDEALEALVKYYRQIGINVTKDEVMVTVGGSEAITFSFLSALNPGDEIIIPEPFYSNYKGYAILAGVNIVPITRRLENGFKLPPKKELESKISQKTKAILISNPGNPTGVVYSPEELNTLREIALDYDLFLISDEVYREFCYEKAEHISVLKLEGLKDHAILVDSISKRFSACGARIGTLASRNKQIMESVLKMAQARLSPPTAEQWGMANFINSSQYPNEVGKMIERYRMRRDLIYNRLTKMEGVTCTMPQGAFYTVARLPVADAEAFVRWLLTDFDLNGETIVLAPLAGFYQTEKLGEDEVRISYVLNKKALGKSMDILEHGLKKYPL